MGEKWEKPLSGVKPARLVITDRNLDLAKSNMGTYHAGEDNCCGLPVNGLMGIGNNTELQHDVGIG